MVRLDEGYQVLGIVDGMPTNLLLLGGNYLSVPGGDDG